MKKADVTLSYYDYTILLGYAWDGADAEMKKSIRRITAGLPRTVLDNAAEMEPLTRVGIAPELMDTPRTLREILFKHRALAQATALEITELMAELQPLFKDEDA